MTNDPIAAYAARVRAEQNDPERAERLREDRRRRRRKIAAIAAGGALALGGFGFWLATATDGERPADEPFAPGMLQEAMWPADWPVTIRMPYPDDGFVHPLFSRELAKKKNWNKVDPYAAGSRPGASTLGACLMPTRT
ncbi:hypothetical protein ACFVQ4_13140 [Streptomyces laurentii]|uniref:hypothetical protein n=1 Tax=Streptomyces laurentii TaxID=39478 RepID=UPI0036A0B0AD